MKLVVLLKRKALTVCVSTDENTNIADINIDCAKYASDANEPTESAIVNLLVDIENSSVALYHRYDPCSDEYSLHEDVSSQLKLFYPVIQSAIRQVKRQTAAYREGTLRKIKKELNLK